MLGIVAPSPPYDDELVQRWIIAAESNGCRFALIANKRDLPGFAALAPRLAACRALGYAVVALHAQGAPIELAPALSSSSGSGAVLVGQSGMGKSTLINSLIPGSGARVGEVSEALRAGRHTTIGDDPVRARFRELDRRFAWHEGVRARASFRRGDRAGVRRSAPVVGHCRFRNCRHGVEPGCAVQDAVERGAIKPWRLALLHRLLAESERQAQAAIALRRPVGERQE